MASLMYYAWSKHGVKPSEIYKMNEGELLLLISFYILELESRHT